MHLQNRVSSLRVSLTVALLCFLGLTTISAQEAKPSVVTEIYQVLAQTSKFDSDIQTDEFSRAIEQLEQKEAELKSLLAQVSVLEAELAASGKELSALGIRIDQLEAALKVARQKLELEQNTLQYWGNTKTYFDVERTSEGNNRILSSSAAINFYVNLNLGSRSKLYWRFYPRINFAEYTSLGFGEFSLQLDPIDFLGSRMNMMFGTFGASAWTPLTMKRSYRIEDENRYTTYQYQGAYVDGKHKAGNSTLFVSKQSRVNPELWMAGFRFTGPLNNSTNFGTSLLKQRALGSSVALLESTLFGVDLAGSRNLKSGDLTWFVEAAASTYDSDILVQPQREDSGQGAIGKFSWSRDLPKSQGTSTVELSAISQSFGRAFSYYGEPLTVLSDEFKEPAYLYKYDDNPWEQMYYRNQKNFTFTFTENKLIPYSKLKLKLVRLGELEELTGNKRCSLESLNYSFDLSKLTDSALLQNTTLTATYDNYWNGVEKMGTDLAIIRKNLGASKTFANGLGFACEVEERSWQGLMQGIEYRQLEHLLRANLQAQVTADLRLNNKTEYKLPTETEKSHLHNRLRIWQRLGSNSRLEGRYDFWFYPTDRTWKDQLYFYYRMNL